MREDYYSAFRKSILQRISALDFAREKVAEYEQSGFTGIKVYEITDWEEDAPKKEEFLNLIQAEYQSKIEDFTSILISQVQDQYQLTHRIRISPGLNVNASLSLNRTWYNFFLKAFPIVNINLGLILAVEDAFGFVLCTKTFFTKRTKDGELTVMNPSFKIGQSHPRRFLDYESLLKGFKGFPQILTTGIPFAPWRLQQFELLSETGVLWAVLHEQSHYVLGHLNRLKKLQGEKRKLSLNESDREDTSSGSVANFPLKHFEMEADSQAVSILYDMYFMNPQAQAIAPYQNLMLRSGFSESQKESVILLNEPKDYLRLLLLSAGLVIILLENKRLSARQKTSNTYPSPVTRLFGVYYTIGIKYLGIDQENNSDRKHSSEELNTLFGAYIESILDLQLAISLLDIENEAFRPFIWEAPEKRNDSFSNDLFDIISKGYFEPDLVSTEAAKEFLSLKQYELSQDE